MSRILVIDDEEVIRSALTRLLNRHGHQVETAGSVAQAERHALCEFDLIIADLRLPGSPGTDVIAKAGGVPVLIMTSYASVKSAVDSMRQGAVDYIAKPFEHDEMLLVVDRIIKEGRMQRQNQALKTDIQREYPVAGMVGSSEVMRDVLDRIARVAPTEANVLILGESGTGKELVARAIHEASPRSDGPIMAVNCGAISDELIESELFGHEKGSFTGAVSARHGLVEAANGGTLFLDEIAELPLTAQAGLLRVLQDGEVRPVGSNQTRRIDVRVVAATNRNLEQLTRDDEFREDVYFRLRVMEIQLPPLRERGADIEELAGFLLSRASARLNKPTPRLDARSWQLIRQYHWPGNVRELENAIERAVILCDGDLVTPELLAVKPAPEPAGGAADSESLDDYFRNFVRRHEKEMTETELARRLGISRKTLWERRQRLGMPRRKGVESGQ